MRLACVVEYDGTGFCGWQRQPGVRTVQATLEQSLGAVADEDITVVCAGRTDAGVHATGQVVHFDTLASRPTRAWLMGTNSHLPGDVAVRWAGPVDEAFHARHSAHQRHYRYLIAEGADRPALWRHRACWSAQSLDDARMVAAAAYLIGEQDFSAFRAAGCQSRTPMRRLDSVTVMRRQDWVLIDVTGNAFLHHMVRIIAGTLMTVGRGERPPGWIGELLAARDRRAAGATAGAQGLYFLGPEYEPAMGVPAPRWQTAFPPADG